MSETTDSENYLWRGSQRIELEKEEEFFTAIVRDEAELERVRSLPGVIEVKPVQNRIFKVHVSMDQRDLVVGDKKKLAQVELFKYAESLSI